MPGPYGDLVSGRTVTATEVKSGNPAVICTLDGEDEGPQEKNVYWRQPIGLRARPRDNRLNAVVTQDGNYPEIMLGWDPQLKLPGIDTGATQLHSCGDAPQLIEVADSKIKIGKDATDSQNCARKGDHVGGGKFTATASVVAGPPVITTLTVQYIDADGTVTPFFTIAFAGTAAVPTPVLPVNVSIREKITEGSKLVKVEGTPE